MNKYKVTVKAKEYFAFIPFIPFNHIHIEGAAFIKGGFVCFNAGASSFRNGFTFKDGCDIAMSVNGLSAVRSKNKIYFKGPGIKQVDVTFEPGEAVKFQEELTGGCGNGIRDLENMV